MEQIPRSQDSSSASINIPTGLPFENSIQMTAFVSEKYLFNITKFNDAFIYLLQINENGVISFANPWSYSSPSRFPTNWYWTRNQYVLAPFWSDNDIRRAGSVRYASISLGNTSGGDDLIARVSAFIQHQNSDAKEQNFNGQWMLVAFWDSVHPYPHGSTGSYYHKYYSSFTQKVCEYMFVT